MTDYYELDGLIEDYSSYFRLWDMVIKFQEQVPHGRLRGLL